MDMSLPAQIQYFQPDALLAPYASVLALTTMDVGADGTQVDMFPVGYSVLSFAMDDLVQDFLHADKTLPRFNITGQLTRYYKLCIKPGCYRFLSVILKPYGAWRLLNFPQDSIADTFADLPQVLGSEATAFGRLVQPYNNDAEATVQLLQVWLIDRLKTNTKLLKLDDVIAACNIIDAGNG
jgi:hypothetical protein